MFNSHDQVLPDLPERPAQSPARTPRDQADLRMFFGRSTWRANRTSRNAAITCARSGILSGAPSGGRTDARLEP